MAVLEALAQHLPNGSEGYRDMKSRCVDIRRVDDPTRAHWTPLKRKKDGRYQLVDSKIPYPARNLTTSAKFVASLEEASRLIEEEGYGIRMAPPGASRGNYIYPGSLHIIWG